MQQRGLYDPFMNTGAHTILFGKIKSLCSRNTLTRSLNNANIMARLCSWTRPQPKATCTVAISRDVFLVKVRRNNPCAPRPKPRMLQWNCLHWQPKPNLGVAIWEFPQGWGVVTRFPAVPSTYSNADSSQQAWDQEQVFCLPTETLNNRNLLSRDIPKHLDTEIQAAEAKLKADLDGLGALREPGKVSLLFGEFGVFGYLFVFVWWFRKLS